MYISAKNSRPRAHVPETSFNNYEPLDNHKKPPPPPEEHLPPSQGDATEETTVKEEPVMEEEEEIGQWHSLYLTSGCWDKLWNHHCLLGTNVPCFRG